MDIHFSQFWRLEHQGATMVEWGPSPWWLLIVSSHGGRDEGSSLGLFFLRTPIPFIRVPPSWPNYFSNTLLPNAISLRVRIQYMNFGGDTSVKTIAVYMGLSSLQGGVSQGLGKLIIYLFILSIWYNTCCRVRTPDIWHLQGPSIQHHQL